ncbi:MAG: 3-hydroxybenzoate 6-monooxygenase [Betaproteobacteria bacterium]|nr:3-hydroxybenzoate 6-monooxygenase [Betaproteobacteria bacterium]
MSAAPTAKRTVIVAGGGIGGMAAAIGLSRAGCKVTVLERAAEFGEIGAGIQLGPNVFHALKTLGVAERTLENAVYIDKLIMMDGMTGDKVAEIPVDAPFREHFRNPYAVIHRADLHAPLHAVNVADPDVTLLPRHEVTGFVKRAGRVEVHTANGASFTGDALVGCDGVRSKVREAIVGDGDPKVSGHIAYRAVLPIEEMPEDLRWNAACLWAGPKCHMVHYPLRGWKLFNIVATFHHPSRTTEGHNEPGDRDELLSYFVHLPAKPRSILEKSRNWRRWVLVDREPVGNWSDGNVTLLGDAAHPTLQYFAQGACMAIEDAVTLMHEVTASPDDLGGAFRRYQDRRITRTARIVLSSRELGRLYHAAGVERLVRNEILGGKTPADFYRSLDWIYGYGRDAAGP